MTIKTIAYIITSSFLFACDSSTTGPKPSIPQVNSKTPEIKVTKSTAKKDLQQTVNLQTNLINNRVFVTSGINIKTGEPSVFNSLNGTEVTPCKEIPLTNPKTDRQEIILKKEKNTQPNCTLTAEDPELRKIIEATRSIKKRYRHQRWS